MGGCSAGSGGSSPWAGGGGVADTSSASPSASGDLIEPTDADTEFDDETSPYDTYSYDDDDTEDPYDTDDPYDTYDPYDTDDPYDDGGGLYPTLPNATPYAADTCFNGPRITSTTPIDVYNMDEVSCSASDAHYKVVKTILESTDLDDCEDVDNAEYAFSETDTDGYGVTTWSAVYCLKGLGSYAVD